MQAFDLLEAVDGGDIRMIEGRERLGLTFESRESFFVARECLGQDFDRYVPPELGVARAVDFSHAPDSDERENFVSAKLGVGLERHIPVYSRAILWVWARRFKASPHPTRKSSVQTELIGKRVGYVSIVREFYELTTTRRSGSCSGP